MGNRKWPAIASLVAGVPLAAWGLAERQWLAALAGLVLLFVFWFYAWQWISGANKPMGGEGGIKPSPNAAWKMKDQPPK